VEINVPSSTSSSEAALPVQRWRLIFGAGLAIFACLLLAMEARLAMLGYEPTLLDSRERWLHERSRASALGERALILVGASRIQLGVDLDVLRQETGLEPVQLALDGSAHLPVLEGLARDPSIRGTVIVDYYDGAIGVGGGAGAGHQAAWEKLPRGGFALPTSDVTERLLERLLHENLRAFSDGATPMLSFKHRIVTGARSTRYLITAADRSRYADYSRVSLPEAYHARVARSLGLGPDQAGFNDQSDLQTLVKSQQALDNQAFISGTRYTRSLVQAIQSRGGKVIFVGMPSSGMVREIEERRYPRDRFWDYFAEHGGARALHSAYEPALGAFSCPDGSHLDKKDRAAFTRELIRALNLQPAPVKA
jgi:hypothetical protein